MSNALHSIVVYYKYIGNIRTNICFTKFIFLLFCGNGKALTYIYTTQLKHMKKITLLLVMIISAYLVNAQTITYSTSGVVNGHYYSSTGFVTVVSVPNYPLSESTFDAIVKAERNGFYTIDTVKKTVCYLDRKLKYDTAIYNEYPTKVFGGKVKHVMYVKRKGNDYEYVAIMDEPLSRKKQMFFVYYDKKRELYQLK